METPDFESLLKRYESGECTAEERARIDRWLDSRGAGDTIFSESQDRRFMEQMLLDRIQETTGRRAGMLRGVWWWKVAASLVFAAGAGYGVWKYAATEPTAGKFATAESTVAGGIHKIQLEDGTLVWLKPGSRLHYPTQFGHDTREVTLEGEALFEVTKDATHPFIIHCGDIVTEVLGTSFNIRSTAAHTEVFVLTGKVSVSLTGTHKNVHLLPRESAIYAHDTRQLAKVVKPGQQEAAVTRGTEYTMSFENIAMRDVAGRIAQKFDVDITLTGPIGDCLITADLTDQSLENTLDILTEAISATYTRHGSEVELTGSGCQ